MSPYDDPAVSAGEIADYLNQLRLETSHSSPGTTPHPPPLQKSDWLMEKANPTITPTINSINDKPMIAFSLPSGSLENNFQPDQISSAVGDPNTIVTISVGTIISFMTQK